MSGQERDAAQQEAEYTPNTTGRLLTTGEQVVPENPTPIPGMDGGRIGELLKENLFKDVRNSIVTIVFGTVFLYIAYKAFGFAFLNEKVQVDRETGETIVRSGWEVIREGPFFVYMVGNRFAESGVTFQQLWIGIYVIAFALGVILGRPQETEPPPMRLGTRLAIVVPPVIGLVVLLSFTTTPTPALLCLGMIAIAFVGRVVSRFIVPNATSWIAGVVLLAVGTVLWIGVGPLLRFLAIALVLWTGGVLWRAREIGVAAAFQGRTSTLVTQITRGSLGLLVFGLVYLGFLQATAFRPSAINQFGGLLLTIVVAFSAITLSFPIGVIAALTRRSSFPLLRPIAVAYIELIRGVPLITLLFMGNFALGFFLPPGTTPPGKIASAIVMYVLFTAAYVAEIVRGGLQSVPAGQVEAGQAVGLQPLTITRRIVLPQALRNSIPALVGQFISVLKDTSLLVIIGQLDLLGITEPVLASLRFTNQGFSSETYAFVAFLFWIMCFSMSRASQRLETRLGVGRR